MNRLRMLAAAAALAVAAGLNPLQARQTPGAVPASPDSRTIVHVLNRLGYGPRAGDVERIRRIGLAVYIDQQLHPGTIADAAMAARLASYITLQMSAQELAEKFYVPAQMERRRRQLRAAPDAAGGEADSPRQLRMNDPLRAARRVFGELAEQKILRAVYSERQLEEVMVDFWFNHFNVFGGKGPTRLYLTGYERDVIRPHALGRFRELLHATAKSPAMLFYLDNWQSAAAEGARTSEQFRAPVKAPGRFGPPDGRAQSRDDVERMGAPRPGNKGRRRPRGLNENYARELLELHTLGVDGGYTQKDVQEVARAFTGWTIAQARLGGPFRFEPRLHDDGEKIVLGRRLAPGGGMRDGEAILDMLARHPSTARFISTKLVRRFVADDPPAALVARAAARFTQTDGDIREVVRTIVTSPEFFAASAYRAKVKTPLEFVASAVRAAGVELRTAMPAVQALRELGMPPYMCEPPTGYDDQASAWVNTGALLNRMNFGLMLMRGPGPDRGAESDLQPDQLTADALVADVLAGDLSEGTRQAVDKATSAPRAIALVLGSPEFQRR